MTAHRIAAFSLGFLCLALSSACGGGALPFNYADGPGMNARRFTNLERNASRRVDCAPEELSYRFVESWEDNLHLYAAEGCGDRYEAVMSCIGICAWLALPTERAAFDLQCSKDEITTTYLEDMTVGFRGCGRSITYLYVEQKWIANHSTDASNATKAN